jgi:hypothetical protein
MRKPAVIDHLSARILIKTTAPLNFSGHTVQSGPAAKENCLNHGWKFHALSQRVGNGGLDRINTMNWIRKIPQKNPA